MNNTVANPEWIDGFRVPWKSKFSFFLLSIFAVVGFGFVGYKMGSLPLISIAAALCIALWSGAFYHSKIFVDEVNQEIYIKKTFCASWVAVHSYKRKCLRRDGGTISSPTFQQYGATGSFDIFLSSSSSDKGVLLFSSSVSEDYDRVVSYLRNYIPICKD